MTVAPEREPDFEAVAEYVGDGPVAVVEKTRRGRGISVHAPLAPSVTPIPRCGPGGNSNPSSFELLTLDQARDRAGAEGVRLRACERCWGNYHSAASSETPDFPLRESEPESTGVADD